MCKFTSVFIYLSSQLQKVESIVPAARCCAICRIIISVIIIWQVHLGHSKIALLSNSGERSDGVRKLLPKSHLHTDGYGYIDFNYLNLIYGVLQKFLLQEEIAVVGFLRSKTIYEIIYIRSFR